ncbi:MAG TPA: ABC transporter permease [Blastocatellia bacterium]|nr:ABC transporter permease [Blastocatellia bacterium]
MATSQIHQNVRASHSAQAAPSLKQSGFRRISAIALNTFRESVRDRVLYNLILFVLVLVGASVFISQLSVDYESQFTSALGLSVMLVFGALIAIFIGVGLVYKEIDKRTIYSLLSKPVRRYEFIIGKYLGLCVTLLVNSAVMVAGIELALLYVNRGFVPLQVAVLPAAFLLYLELILIVAVALVFSSFSTPMLAALFSFAVYVIGHFSADLKLAAELSDSSLVRAVLTGAYYLLPNLANFSYIAEASHGQVVPLDTVMSATAYAIVYIAILLSASVLIFEKRNFK